MKEQLTELLSGLRHARDDEWVNRTIEQSEEALNIFNRADLGRATMALGALKADLVSRHPSIAPVPRWTLAAATVASGERA